MNLHSKLKLYFMGQLLNELQDVSLLLRVVVLNGLCQLVEQVYIQVILHRDFVKS